MACACDLLHVLHHLRTDQRAALARLTTIEQTQETIVSSIADIQATADQIAAVADGLKVTADDIAADVQRLLAAVAAADPAAIDAAAASLTTSLGKLSGVSDELVAVDEAGGEPPAPPVESIL